MKFPKLVIEEAKALKNHATKKEIANLKISEFDPQGTKNCIYGQMTGYCHSERSIELIKKCASKVYTSGEGFPHEGSVLNGSPVGLTRKKNYHITFWSPIEVFVSGNDKETNGKLIQFIKGEIKTL